ncbi:MAG TPA: hypothetical protein VMG10_23730 [Gemmataceae bacterium]|nr:hypothetical protein [Gemmataceae bacterium]
MWTPTTVVDPQRYALQAESWVEVHCLFATPVVAAFPAVTGLTVEGRRRISGGVLAGRDGIFNQWIHEVVRSVP